MTKRYVLLALLCAANFLIPHEGFAQYPPTTYNGFMRTDMISPSPTAANLGKFGNVPITYYTGLPNVSIPIFTVEGNDLKLPITLSYNYNGFRPAEEASWVGLGWSLQAGGVISRTLGDKVDEHYLGASEKYNKAPNLQQLASQQYLTNAYANGAVDMAPDIYSFNFAGYSGQFVLYDGVFSITPKQKFKITGTPAGGFTIVTEDGTKYLFSEKEVSMSKSQGDEPYIIPAYNSSWYLTKITNAAGTESITLEYETEGPIYQYGSMVQSYQQKISGYVSGPNGGSYSNSVLSSPTAAFKTKVQDAKRLIAIHSEKHNVFFMPDDGYSRQDIDGNAYPLWMIYVYNAKNKKIKHFELKTEYLGSYPNKFLKLKRLLQYDTTDINYIQHQFEYENESDFYGAYQADGVDHYGYLNSAGTVSNYFPPSIYPNSGVSREPVFELAKQGALKKIIYPTGGSTELEYDPNTYYQGPAYLYSYIINPYYETVNNNVQSTIVQAVDTFSTNYPQTVEMYLSRVPRITPSPGVVETDHSSVYEVKIEQIIEDYYQTIGTYRIDSNVHNAGKLFKIVLPNAGLFQVTTRCDGTETNVTAVLSGKKRYVRDTVEGKGGAGIRIKKIIENPVIGQPVIRKYSYADENGFSTALGISEPMYRSQPFVRNVYDIQLFSIGTVNFIDHTSMVSEAPDTGLPFFYRRVTEEVVSGSLVSRTRYYFDHVSGFNDADLVKQIDYKYENGTFAKVHKVENAYNAVPLDVFTGISIFRVAENIYEGGGDPQMVYEWGTSGSKYIGWKSHAYSREVMYAGVDSLVTEVTNTYNMTTLNLQSVRRKNSDGSSLNTKYKYPEDYISGIGNGLVQANMIMPLEEQTWRESPSDTVLIAGKIYQYNASKKVEKIYAFESASGITALNSETKTGGAFNTLISDTRYKSKIDFTYHGSGKLITQQVTNDAPTSYLWGYAANTLSTSSNGWNNYPIAEIRNATPGEVFYSSFEETGTTQYAKTGRRSFSGVYTISGSYTGDYKLTYWKKTGSGPWQLIESTVANPSNVQIGASGSWIDEVRLCPVKATMKTYTYFEGWGLSEVNDANNVISHFRYDPFGRLLSIRDDQANILSNYQYHYKNSGSN